MLASAAQQCEPAVCTLHPLPLAPAPPLIHRLSSARCPAASHWPSAPHTVVCARRSCSLGASHPVLPHHTRWCVHVGPALSVHPTLCCPTTHGGVCMSVLLSRRIPPCPAPPHTVVCACRSCSLGASHPVLPQCLQIRSLSDSPEV